MLADCQWPPARGPSETQEQPLAQIYGRFHSKSVSSSLPSGISGRNWLFSRWFTPRVKRRGIDNKLRLHLCSMRTAISNYSSRGLVNAPSIAPSTASIAVLLAQSPLVSGNTSQRLACHSLQKETMRRIRLFEVFLTYTTSLAEVKRTQTRASTSWQVSVPTWFPAM